MKRIIILIPTYNDCKSLRLLLSKINKYFNNEKIILEILIINDCSSEKYYLKDLELKNIKSIKIINLTKNIGSQKAIFIGLNKIAKLNKRSTIVIMDSDGEDDPAKISKLANKANQNDDVIIFALRKERLETFFLQLLNKFRLLITFLLTGKYFNFGNFSAFSNKNLKNLIKNKNLSIAYCGGVLKNHHKIDLIPIPKKKRYHGISKVSFFFLIKHSINIISIFYIQVFLRTTAIFLFLTYFNFFDLNNLIIVFFLITNLIFFFFYSFGIINGNFRKFISKVTKIK